MKMVNVTPFPSLLSAVATTCPTVTRRKYTGVPTSVDPRSSARSMNCRPGSSPVTIGATSSPTKSRRDSLDLPMSMPMKPPESSVPSPDTPPAVMRGRTTKNRVSSRRNSSDCLLSSAVTTMPFRFGLKVMVLTRPISTSLYLIFVLPASRPSAVLKVMVIVGPRSRIALAASQPPTSTATMGMIQMSCGVKRRLGTATASGRSCASGSCGLSATRRLHWVPDQARIEALRREHRQHHHGAERDGAGAGPDGHQPSELHERGEESGDIDVDHRPAADEFEHPVQPRALCRRQDGATLHGHEQVGQGEQLGERDRDARDEEDDRERPRPVDPEKHHAAHDGVGLRPEERAGDHDGQEVRRNDENVRGDEERPGPLEAVRLAGMEGGAAARADEIVRGADRTVEKPAGVAGHEPRLGGGHRGHRTSSTRSQRACVSNEAAAAATRNIKAPNDHSAIPGTTEARAASFVRATRVPSRNTSTMPHGRTACTIRNTAGRPRGTRPSLSGRSR